MWLGKKDLISVIGKKTIDLYFACYNFSCTRLVFLNLTTLSPWEFPPNGKIGEHATSQWKGANKYPQFIIRVLDQAKNGDQQFWKEKYRATNGKAQHALMDNQVFSLWRGRGGRDRDFFVFSLVPNVFPMCSHQVLNVFPKCSLRVSQ